MDVAAIHQARFSWDSATISAPSLRTLLCLPLFLFASGLQYDCHQHLSTLKKYTVPTHPWFRRLVCPHYTAECVIYLALSIMAAPKGSLVNKTMLTVLIFVTTNLAITADKARAFYIQKFGHDSVSSKWRIIPFVF
jgi:3-oxo-5-alpha-steroid 4-dehydrogenase 3